MAGRVGRRGREGGGRERAGGWGVNGAMTNTSEENNLTGVPLVESAIARKCHDFNFLTSTWLIISCCIVTLSTGYLPAADSAESMTEK